jgi:hypothetical protein
VIERLMQKSAELRYNNCEELVEALHVLARHASDYAPPLLTPAAYVAPRSPTTTPFRSTATLLSAMNPRQVVAAPPSATEMTPPPRSRIPATATESSLSISAHRTAQSLPPHRPTIWEWLERAILFWKPTHDTVVCTLLAPCSVLPGESVGLQVILHDVSRTDQAKALPDWRGSVAIASPLERGASVDLHVEIQEFTITKPLQQVKWAGFSAATIFNLRMPETWQTGTPVQGTLSVSVQQQLAARLDFVLPISATNSALPL